jgi:hypothetical protein
MAILTPVNITHNNPELPTVYFSDVKGNIWATGSDGNQYGIPEGKRELGMIVYFSSSQDFKYYKGGTTASGDWSTSANWETLGSSNFVSYNFTASFSNESTWNVYHNLGYRYVIIQTFDNSGNQILPSEITLTNTNTASATFPEPTSGTAVVTFGGATFNNPQLPSNPVNSVQYNNGGVFGGSDNFTFDGNSLYLKDPTGARYSFINNSPYFNYSEVLPKTFITSTYVEQITNQNSSIQEPIGDTFDKSIWSGVSASPWDIVFLSGSDNTWYPIVYNSASLSSRLLGIYNDNDSVIITEGYVVVAAVASSATDAPLIHGALEPGSPVYLSGAGAGSAPFISTTRPNSSGDVVRIVGHLMYQNPITTDYWLMHFRPDHTWVEIS